MKILESDPVAFENLFGIRVIAMQMLLLLVMITSFTCLHSKETDQKQAILYMVAPEN